MEIKLEKVVAGTYKVIINGKFVARVEKCKHGIWKSWTNDMLKISTYNNTRKEAVEGVVAWYEAKKQAEAVEVTEVPVVEVIEKKQPIAIGDTVVCMWGTNKGVKFVVKSVLDNGNFSLQIADGSNDRYYEYGERHLEKVNPSTDVNTNVSTKVATNISTKTDTEFADEFDFMLKNVLKPRYKVNPNVIDELMDDVNTFSRMVKR